MVIWRIYYGDGSTFDSSQGSPQDAPGINVQVIAKAAGIDLGRLTIASKDFYWFDRGEWFGGDVFGLWDYLAQPGLKVVKFGRLISLPIFQEIMRRAVTDSDLIPKVAWHDDEVKTGPIS